MSKNKKKNNNLNIDKKMLTFRLMCAKLMQVGRIKEKNYGLQ